MDKMRQNRTILAIALLAGLLPTAFTGCQKDGLQTAEKVSIPLAFSVGRVSEGLSTKMTDKVVQVGSSGTDAPFRGIQDMYIVPFSLNSTDVSSRSGKYEIISSDKRFDANISVPNPLTGEYADEASSNFYGLIRNNNAHLFPNVTVMPETNAVLVYAQATEDKTYSSATDSVAFRHRNGVIVPTGALTTTTKDVPASEIRFALKPMLPTDKESTAFTNWQAANLLLLNQIANSYVSVDQKTYTFRIPSGYGYDADLTAALNTFTGEGRIFSGSDVMIGKVLTELYRTCYGLKGMETSVTQKLSAKVCENIASKTDMLTLYGEGASAVVSMKATAPASFGLPDGVATLRWDTQTGEPRFVVPGQADGLDVANVRKYCYPPALWYYSNSPFRGFVRTPGVTNPTVTYVKTYSWDDIVKGYTQNGIDKKSDGAVITEPLQYAVASLKLSLKKAGALKDAKGTTVDIANKNYPLVGIIIGGQQTQQFDFTPNASADKQYIYDSDLVGTDGKPRAWISSTDESNSVYTLAFETLPGDNVNFALEFRNDSDTPLYGVRECTVMPGGKFYLVGTMKYSDGVQPTGTTIRSVFTRDCTTTLNVSFDTLALAYCYEILPELSSSDLKMAVNAKLTWEFLTPKTYQIAQ